MELTKIRRKEILTRRDIYDVKRDSLLITMGGMLEYWAKVEKSGFENLGSEEVLFPSYDVAACAH